MMMKDSRAFLLATTAVTAFAGYAIGAPLVVNGGFETGDLTGWTTAAPNFTSVDTVSNSGIYALAAGCEIANCIVTGPPVTGHGSISQSINLAPGIYQLSYALTNPGGGGTEAIAASLGNNVVVNDGSVGTFGYTSFNVLSAVSGGPTTLAFAIEQDPSFMHLDDIALVQVDDGAGNNLAAASQTVAAQASREFMDSIYDRFGHSGSPMQLASAGETMVASSDGMMYINGPGHYRAFLNVYGDDARWDSGDVRSHRFGLQIGAEWAPCNDWEIGISLADGTSHFRTDTFFTSNRGRADEILGALYTSWNPHNGPFYATGVIGYGRSRNDFSREDFFVFGGARADNVDTKQWFGGVEVGFDWRAASKLVLTPFARIDGARLSQDGYTEQAWGMFVPAVVDSKDQSVGRALLGLRASTEFHAIGSYPWQLTAKGAWQHEFDRSRDVNFSETTGPVTFFGTATGATPVANSAVVGASLEAPLSANASLYVGYNGDFGSGQRIHEGEVGFKVTW